MMSWRGLDFGEPWWLLLFVPIVAWLWWRRGRRPTAILFSRADLLARGPARGRWTARALVSARVLALVAATVALARPRAGARVEQVNGDGISIVLAIDLSSSMLAEDFQPQNRLEVAKDKVKQFVAARTVDQVGLVAFAGEALTQVPLTVDYPVVIAAVDNLQPGQLEDGTAIGTAIATSSNRLVKAPGRSKVLILLTDGVNNRGTIDPRTAAQAAAALGIRVYTIGVGSEGMAPVPVGRGAFGLRYELRPVELDEPLLEYIAQVSGGRYFRARDGLSLQRIYEQIDKLERSPIRAQRFVRYRELFRWPLGFALFAAIGELLLLAWRGPLP
ncbi:MAG: VWA domain-containing protein [Gemmatimonadetes bacterium]|jgi:Ca-activated chloride channel family protein|nr:VWA domain-containing protein [Gemmatimonadota bacterium]